MAKNHNNDTTDFGCTPFCRWGAFSICGVHFQLAGFILSASGTFAYSRPSNLPISDSDFEFFSVACPPLDKTSDIYKGRSR